MKSNVVTIVLVVAVAAAIAGAAFVYINMGDDDNEAINKSPLPVFGNANEDGYVDSEDIDLINKMRDEGISIDTYPFADANRDSVLDDEDIRIVEDIIAGNETEITFVDQYDLVKEKYRYVTIDYPLKDVVTQNADMLLLTQMIDADDRVAGYIANIANYPAEFYKVTHNGYTQCVGTTARYIAASDWEGIKDLDVKLQEKGSKVGAILVHSDAAVGDYKEDIEAAGIPLIYLRCTDPVYSIDAGVLLGFLMGPDHFEKAVKYGTTCLDTIQEISEKVGEISDDEKKRFISLCMICYVGQSESQYTKIGLQAGGREMSGLSGNTSVKLEDTEAITKYNDSIDYILNCSTQDCVNVTAASLWEDAGVRYIETSTHYEDMVWINMSMPVPCRVMYAASVFYPDIVSREAADDYFQSIVDSNMSYLNNTVSDGDFDVTKDMFTIITYEDYKNEGSGGGSSISSDVDPRAIINHFDGVFDYTGYQGEPFAVSSENTDQSAAIYPTSGSYYVKATLYKDAQSAFEEIKAAYQAKVGTQSGMGGTYYAIDDKGGMTDGYGYYVNTTNDNSIGSMYYTAYYKECLIEVHLGYKPSISEAQLENIVDCLWGTEGTVSAVESANKFDVNLLSEMRDAPYSVSADSTSLKATISSAGATARSYYISYDNSDSAFLSFEADKIVFAEKVESGDYMGGVPIAIGANDFEDGYGFIGNTTKGFSMIQFVGLKDGCYTKIYIRVDDRAFEESEVISIVNAVAATIS